MNDLTSLDIDLLIMATKHEIDRIDTESTQPHTSEDRKIILRAIREKYVDLLVRLNK